MALIIRNRETEGLAEMLVRLTGETTTEAVTRAIRERLNRVLAERSGRPLADELDEIALHCSRLPVQDNREADAIARYDENGLPR